MTEQERAVFEELLRAGSAIAYKMGQRIEPTRFADMSMAYVRASNAAETILDALRSPAERRIVEAELEKLVGGGA